MVNSLKKLNGFQIDLLHISNKKYPIIIIVSITYVLPLNGQ